MSGTRRVAVGLALALTLAACSTSTPSPSPVSAEAARSTAVNEMGGGLDLRTISTRLSTYGDVTGSGAAVDANTPVWVVLMTGTFPASACGTPSATPHPCPSPATTAQVLIDARTGVFVRADVPAPLPTSTIDCGPLEAASCQQAVTVAVSIPQLSDSQILSVQILTPSAQATCPPSGGPAGARVCGAIAVVTTPDGQTTIGLVQSDFGWMWSAMIP